MDEITLQRHDREEAGKLAEDLADLYRAVYGTQEPQASNPFYSRERFLQRLDGYRAAPGYQLIVARENDRMVGFLYGYVLQPGARWWSKVEPPLPEEFTRETGDRTFAVNDMVVAADRRRRGIARAMHAELLAAHPGMRFTLTVRPDNTPARSAYQRWGYRIVGRQQPYPDSPVFEMMVLESSAT
ncbi:GNAT family N-acetyltransferase [Carbonactinospora thermoautotrophica]|uniref:GNAT family N-acetyltransferase n=1 Tax=Carbonactinospora thermoautotrophica TaxID=1469144 RepID=UPI0022707E20|nr:GNAT family N-acetyltransferase [Carbonactinospora thermoautotrophica]